MWMMEELYNKFQRQKHHPTYKQVAFWIDEVYYGLPHEKVKITDVVMKDLKKHILSWIKRYAYSIFKIVKDLPKPYSKSLIQKTTCRLNKTFQKTSLVYGKTRMMVKEYLVQRPNKIKNAERYVRNRMAQWQLQGYTQSTDYVDLNIEKIKSLLVLYNKRLDSKGLANKILGSRRRRTRQTIIRQVQQSGLELLAAITSTFDKKTKSKKKSVIWKGFPDFDEYVIKKKVIERVIKETDDQNWVMRLVAKKMMLEVKFLDKQWQFLSADINFLRKLPIFVSGESEQILNLFNFAAYQYADSNLIQLSTELFENHAMDKAFRRFVQGSYEEFEQHFKQGQHTFQDGNFKMKYCVQIWNANKKFDPEAVPLVWSTGQSYTDDWDYVGEKEIKQYPLIIEISNLTTIIFPSAGPFFKVVTLLERIKQRLKRYAINKSTICHISGETTGLQICLRRGAEERDYPEGYRKPKQKNRRYINSSCYYKPCIKEIHFNQLSNWDQNYYVTKCMTKEQKILYCKSLVTTNFKKFVFDEKEFFYKQVISKRSRLPLTLKQWQQGNQMVIKKEHKSSIKCEETFLLQNEEDPVQCVLQFQLFTYKPKCNQFIDSMNGQPDSFIFVNEKRYTECKERQVRHSICRTFLDKEAYKTYLLKDTKLFKSKKGIYECKPQIISTGIEILEQGKRTLYDEVLITKNGLQQSVFYPSFKQPKPKPLSLPSTAPQTKEPSEKSKEPMDQDVILFFQQDIIKKQLEGRISKKEGKRQLARFKENQAEIIDEYRPKLVKQLEGDSTEIYFNKF